MENILFRASRVGAYGFGFADQGFFAVAVKEFILSYQKMSIQRKWGLPYDSSNQIKFLDSNPF